MLICTIALWVYVILSCFKQLPLNSTLVLVPRKFNKGLRILLDLAGGLILSSDSALDFHSTIWQVSPIFLKYLYIGWNTK